MTPSPADLQRVLDAIPYARWLGLRAQAVEGEALAVLPYAEPLIGNPAPAALHGGVIGAFLELAATAHLAASQGLARPPKPIGVTVDYLRSGRPQATFARAEIRRLGRRVANVRAEAWQDDAAAPIAALHGHFLIPAAPAGESER